MRSGLRAADAGDQMFHVPDGCLRNDPMSEIEDMRPTLDRPEDAVDALVERLASGHQSEGIEIALGREMGRQRREQQRRIGRPVEREGIPDPGGREAMELSAATPDKDD